MTDSTQKMVVQINFKTLFINFFPALKAARGDLLSGTDSTRVGSARFLYVHASDMEEAKGHLTNIFTSGM